MNRFADKQARSDAQQALVRANNSNGGSLGPDVDTSQMLGQSGLAGYWSFPNTVTPTDNQYPNTSTIAGFTNSIPGNLITSGLVLDAQFTTQGGQPIPGNLCWFANSSDDFGSGAGKLTASMPTEGLFTLAFSQGPAFPQNAVPAGIVESADNYADKKTCVIRMLPSPVRNKTKSTISWTNNCMSSISDTNYLSVPGDTAGCQLGLGTSIGILYTLEATNTGPAMLTGNYDASFAKGWLLEGGSSVNLAFGNGAGSIALGPSGRGLNWALVSIGFDGTMYGANFSESGAPTTFVSAVTSGIVPATSTQTMRIGGPLATFGPNHSWGPLGRIVAEFILGGPLSPAEMHDIGDFTPKRKRNPFRAPEWLISQDRTEWDPRLNWYWNAAIFLSTFGSTSFTWTPQGAPTTTVRSKSLLRNPAPYFVDTLPPQVDTLGIPRTNGGARLILPVTADSQILNTQYACDDWQGKNDDNGNVNVDGTFFAQVPVLEGAILPDGIKRWSNIAIDSNDTPSSHTLTLINGDPATDLLHGAFITAVACDLSSIEPFVPTVSARQILVGDGAAFAQDSGTTNRILYGLQNLIRGTFTGSVTFEGSGAASIGEYTNNGTTSIDFLAHRICLELDERNGDGTLPTSFLVNSYLGLYDWLNPWGTVVEWGLLYRALFDKIHSLRPLASLVAQLQWQVGLGTNSMGQTIAEYNTELLSVMAGSPYRVVDVSTGPGGTITQCGPPLPPYRATQAGLVAWQANMRAAIGW